ncbi:hypothetical protein [Synechococcus phage S-B64]|uniref:Uncharacterized protein n=2 Tax=Shandvirus TaxID=2948904 RepID=A0A1Z1LWG8_9CAUD|nr:hypothetical protein KNT63_gp131 [Synechococcus phage S-H35]YP_010095305.1 hypothetical protein KNT88_gp067 [Synechococcus phage S-B64]ARW57012.1 hypothetical protein [Synechococcus phage S-H35]AWD90103.1 hypothetical protein [Synechococcus phage S-B64]
MSVRIVRTRSGEDVISDLYEVTTKEDQETVIAFQLVNPYSVWIQGGMTAEADGEIHKLTAPEISFEPWMPLLKGKAIMLKLDEVITAYETHDEVIEKYQELVEATSGKSQSDSAEERESE